MTSTLNHKKKILADTHVHLHDCFDLDVFLNSALDNFKKNIQNNINNNSFIGVLLLTEINGIYKFKTLFNEIPKSQELSVKNWNFHRTQEDCSIYATCGKQDLFLIAGRQVVTEENLEVLGLITAQDIEDGLPLKETIETIIAKDAIPVLPWGFGKWMGKRGQFLDNFLAEHHFPQLFLGDNGGRPSFWSNPILFQKASQKGMRILPGTDPLPLSSEVSRPGSFGLMIEQELNPEYPGKSLQDILFNYKIPFKTYGQLETPFRFLRNQVEIRL